VKLRIVYDNEAKEGLESDWGFSCLIEARERTILFDTGASDEILAHNLQQLGVQKEDVGIIALSHEHMDHVGGLGAVLHPEVIVYLPRSFSSRLKQGIAKHVAKVIEVSGPMDITPGVYSTGELGLVVKEQSLVLETQRGIVVVTGCAHPGLENIVEASESFGDVYGVIGGFHGFNKLGMLKGLQLIIPCHCTSRKREILAIYPEKAVRCEAGRIVEL
jgi:7,8-dihydropterin-6-yl-methyl-4-(beta-D-ribofuranosyl)aminobenzene 5'-phosphate synthase